MQSLTSFTPTFCPANAELRLILPWPKRGALSDGDDAVAERVVQFVESSATARGRHQAAADSDLRVVDAVRIEGSGSNARVVRR